MKLLALFLALAVPAAAAPRRKPRPAENRTVKQLLDGGSRKRAVSPRRNAPEEEAEVPPYHYKRGALIRTAGQEYKKEAAAAPPPHDTPYKDIELEEGKAVAVRGAGPRQGKKDTPPPCSPGRPGCGSGGGGSSGGSAITPNTSSSSDGN